jgi:REP element-mobilizing transposase RayT
MVTRRVTQRRFYLKPSRAKKVAKAIRYCIARAATLTGVKVHVVAVMSNHYHIIVTDPHGLIPYFTEILNKNLGRCLNALYGRWENFWASGAGPSYVRLPTASAVLDKCVYALTNPVEAGLVASRGLWPGELLEQPGKYKAEKPDWFFRSEEDGGALPAVGLLVLTPAPVAPTAHQSIQLIKQAADDREAEIRRLMKEKGRRFIGPEAVIRQSPDDTPDTVGRHRRLSPTLACKDKWRRIEELQVQSGFKREHRRCMERWMAGDRDVLFPFGTYKMRVIHRARIAEA